MSLSTLYQDLRYYRDRVGFWQNSANIYTSRMNDTAAQLQHLQDQLAKAQATLNACNQIIHDLQDRIQGCNASIVQLQDDIRYSNLMASQAQQAVTNTQNTINRYRG